MFELLADLNELEDFIEESVEATDQNIETKALSHVEQARSVKIVNQATYNGTVEILLANKDLQKEVVEHHRPIKKAQWDAWQVTIAQENKVLDPLKDAEKILKDAIGRWDTEQKRIAAEEQRRLNEIASAERAKEIATEVEQARAAGAPPAQVQAIIQQPRPVPQPVAAPTFQKSKAVPVTETFACRVDDIKGLCRAVVEGVASTELIMGLNRDKETGIISSPALDRMAATLKTTFQIPGCALITGTRVSARPKRTNG